MKGFHREHPQFSQCGLNCLLCPMQINGYCPGCGGGEGNQSCAIARCAIEHGIGEFCFQCPGYPCQRYQAMMEYDSFLPHSRMIQDLELSRREGLEVYITQISERRAILDQLLAGWNDGRRKSFYCLAAYLLDLDSLRCVFEHIQASAPEEMTVKEKAMIAAAALNSAAQEQGIALKLNKKPKER